MNILGISAYYHDSAAALVVDGRIVAAAQEERFTRKKHDDEFPLQAVRYCLKEAAITVGDVDLVVFYEKPFVKFERLLESYLHYAPRGLKSFLKAMPVWIKHKLWIREHIASNLNYSGKIIFAEHHESHAASAFFASPFDEAAVLTMDGVGEWATSSIGIGRGNRIDLIQEMHFPHSLGLLYSAFTYYTGFRVNSGEYKVMGLAPYGEPVYVDLILKELVDLKDDGSFHLNMTYFNFAAGLTMTNEKFNKLFGAAPRKPETPLRQRDMDLARSVQEVTEMIMLRMARHAREVTGLKNLCLAGGVALNCVGNGKILEAKIFDRIWIQPAAGDAGGALGAALIGWHHYMEKPRLPHADTDAVAGSYLGPEFTDAEIEAFLKQENIPYVRLERSDLVRSVCELLAQEKVIGWFQGRLEFGPRALGNRSIIGDARSSKMQEIMNLKIKFRESFRPFAPSVIREKVSDYFELDSESPYMLLVAPVASHLRLSVPEEEKGLFGIDKLKVRRSEIPAVTHVDYSARVQTVDKDTNPLYHELIREFGKRTGFPVIINTSFNVRGEPLVCSPAEAYRCFMRTHMDCLVMGSFLLQKEHQPKMKAERQNWQKEFVLD